MATATISLPDDQWAQLRLYAAMKGRPLDDVIREAVEAYLAREEAAQELDAERNGHASAASYVTEPQTSVFDPEWRAEFDEALARLREQVPPGLTPEEIDAEIDAAWAEVREERRGRRRHGG
jgi:plasmid stability protein